MDKQFLESLLDSVAVPVVLLDSDLKVVEANSPARITFDPLSNGTDAVQAISNKPGFLALLRKSLDDAVETSCKVKLKQGIAVEFQATIRPVDWNEGRLLMVTFTDRTPLKDAKTMRSDFVANVSHEIRSPLTALSGFVETLQGAARDDPEAQEHFLKLMEKEIVRMTNLVSDLLSLSQVEAKKRRTPTKNVDPGQIVAQAVSAVCPMANKRGRKLEVQIEGLLPDLPGKHDDLVRLLINLLENAINYSRAGTDIRLVAFVVRGRSPLKKPALCIAVHDQGDGILAQDIPRLTERFYRVDKSRSRDIGGTGLGLAIVKHILVRHRGELVIKSVLGEGSTFAAYLPLAN